MTCLTTIVLWILNVDVFVFAVPAKVIWYKEAEENPA